MNKTDLIIRGNDIVISLFFIVFLLPLFIVIALWILLDSPGGVFYKQSRVGLNNKDFKLYKFRSMGVNSDKKGLLTVGSRDSRITRSGYFIRKYKLDELPQIINVLKGDMSFVGPRPEVRRYVDLYTAEQRKILTVKPGITDNASVEFFNENDILSKVENPEKEYIDNIMPLKLKLNQTYIKNKSLKSYYSIIFSTLKKII